jgi:hypothetical protein
VNCGVAAGDGGFIRTVGEIGLDASLGTSLIGKASTDGLCPACNVLNLNDKKQVVCTLSF